MQHGETAGNEVATHRVLTLALAALDRAEGEDAVKVARLYQQRARRENITCVPADDDELPPPLPDDTWPGVWMLRTKVRVIHAHQWGFTLIRPTEEFCSRSLENVARIYARPRPKHS